MGICQMLLLLWCLYNDIVNEHFIGFIIHMANPCDQVEETEYIIVVMRLCISNEVLNVIFEHDIEILKGELRMLIK